MVEPEGALIVGVLGQWASGKSTAAKTLVKYLGGEDQVVFLVDQSLLARQAVDYLLELEDSKATLSLEDDGRRRLGVEHVAVWLGPGEDLRTVDVGALEFHVADHLMPEWLHYARIELGHQICERCADGKPVVVEVGFGQHPSGHTLPELFLALEDAGVEPELVKWIVVEACYEKRSERNEKRRYGPPVEVFARYAADGGDLDSDQQKRLEEGGIAIRRVCNDHDDVQRFRADIIAAYEEMFGDQLPASAAVGRRLPSQGQDRTKQATEQGRSDLIGGPQPS